MEGLIILALVMIALLVSFVFALSAYFRWRHEGWDTSQEEFKVNYTNVQGQHGQDLEGK